MPRRPDNNDLLDRTLALTAMLGSDMTSGLAGLGLTQARAHLLWLLRTDRPVTQRQLSEQLAVSARNVTGLVDALVESGLVTRSPHPTDRRAVLVTLTRRGTRIVGALVRDHDALAKDLFAGLPAKSVTAFSDALDLVLVRLTELVHSNAAGRRSG